MSDETNHPDAKWLFWKWKRGGEILTKPDAYRIGNELERLQLLVTALQTELDLLRDANARLAASRAETPDDDPVVFRFVSSRFSNLDPPTPPMLVPRVVQTFREEPPATVDDPRPDPDEQHGDEP